MKICLLNQIKNITQTHRNIGHLRMETDLVSETCYVEKFRNPVIAKLVQTA